MQRFLLYIPVCCLELFILSNFYWFLHVLTMTKAFESYSNGIIYIKKLKAQAYFAEKTFF